MWSEWLIALAALGVALSLRPWRAVAEGGPPWPWLAWWAAMPLMWGADQYAHIPLVQPLSGACLLMLMAGWPLAVLSMTLTAAITAGLGTLDWQAGLTRYVWLGVVPASLSMFIGAAIRRWLPHHLFIYILGRGFFATVISLWLAGWLALLARGAPAGVDPGDLMIGRWLAGWGDAFLTGMWTAIFVAFRPQWLATYSDRLYLPPPPAKK